MADGDRSVKSKAIAVDYEISSTRSHKRSSGINSDGSPSSSHPVDRHDEDMDTRIFMNQQEDPNPGYWTTSNGGGSGSSFWTTNNGGGSGSSFPLPFSGGAGMPGHQHVRTGNQYTGAIGSSTQHSDFYHVNGNRLNFVGGSAGAAFPPPRIGYGMHCGPHHASNSRRPRSPLRWSMEQMDSFIGNSLRALSIRDDRRSHDSLLARGGRRLSEFVSNNRERRDLLGADGQNSRFIGHRGLLNAADEYAGRRLEDVRGTMRSIARTLGGCEFLVRMVAEGGAAAAQQVLDEVAGEIVCLMVHTDGHALVEALIHHLSDEHIAHVLRILDAASPVQIVAVGTNNKGSNILQTLIGRTARNPEHAEFFTRTLSRVGQMGVLSLVENLDGSRLIMRCLHTFSAAQNQFITVAMAMSLDRVCRDRHGCHVMIKCIDMAGVDEQAWSSFVRAVCRDGLALAEHGCGNFVVQHVIRRVPAARGSLHAAFRGRYVSLSTQMASSHVVQRCLEFFSPEQADEIVGELLGCGVPFMELIGDRFANYVLQTAMDRGEIQMHNTLLDAIIVHRDELRANMFARNVYHKLRTMGRLYI